MRVVAAEQAAQFSGKSEGAADFDGLPQMTSVAMSIRQPTLNPTRKEIATRKRQELPVQQASLGTALSPGVVRKEEVEDAQPDVLRARIAQKVEVGVGVSIGGATGQAVVAGRGSHGGGAGGRCGGRTARRVARALSPTRVGVDGAAGQVAVGEADSGTVGQEGVAGRGARDYGARGGRKAPRVASTPSAEGDEVDSSEVGFDMDVGMDVYGAAGQAVGSSRAVRGLVAAAPDSPRPGSAAPTGETGAAHVHRLSCFRTST
ncbi:hypothetical protein PC111_g21518 [Phytophthora cactorum]|nr:hypothetical protein PC111_g21518 [Phytophthora cactorum]